SRGPARPAGGSPPRTTTMSVRNGAAVGKVQPQAVGLAHDGGGRFAGSRGPARPAGGSPPRTTTMSVRNGAAVGKVQPQA
ncbi:hypothetical protein C0Q16_29310, partial [Klebsiella pneumoniae]